MTISRRLLFFVIIIFSVVSFSACGQSSQYDNKNNPPSPPFSKGGIRGFADEKKLKILTTIAPLYSFTKNITGDLADVDNLLPPGAGPHEYSFSPSDIKRLTKAHMLIKNGLDLETWLDKAVTSFNIKDLIIVDTSAGADAIDSNPHIWLSPKHAIVQVMNIRKALIEADPGRKELYINNADSYIKRLEKLDRDIKEEVKKWGRKEFVSFHPAFLYFAGDYGLRQVAVIQESPEKEPSPKHVANVMKTIREKGVQFIFSEILSSPKIVDTIAKDLNLQVYKLDTLETGTLSPEWYEERIRKNLAVFKKALN